ncbi:glycosyltransferase, group 1 family (plasmid) [Legionella adelaidensis]|uniref:Glycosyltransferase, group 1 family n=1 Tax=Legionella adelaidensis TaxID=45056 RepID=A0A0W0R4P3_9GAMM|nr:glycosyltransferase family 4 protein [Legionella adelaidensis]KTC66035.1 glycosyltransferase, group 1 family [Legionella adelaidensis]VEH85694.1 glycosyltransferase, group 1 family [Legionella adelaidensis]
MNILVISQYYWPETFIISDLVKCLKDQGHFIEVITGKPNYPDGDIFPGYKAYGIQNEMYEGVMIHRVPIIPRKKGVKNLILNYFSFILSGLFYFPRLVKNKKFDVTLVFVPSPITSVIPAIFLKWRTKSHLAVWVQDLWPESISATGFVKSKLLLKPLEKLVQWIYSKSDTLLVQSNAFIKPISKYTSVNKVFYYPNPFLEPAVAEEKKELPQKLLAILEQNKCFVFAGNLGNAQSVETIIQAGKKLTHLEDCKIILIGSGSRTAWIKEEIEQNNLTNILLPGRFSLSAMPLIFKRASALLVTLKNEEIFTYTIPSKIQAYLAAAKPILAALNGEGARIVEVSQSGLVSPAEDAIALAKNIERIYHMPAQERERMGDSGRAYFLKHFEMTKQAQRLVEIFNNRILQESIE